MLRSGYYSLFRNHIEILLFKVNCHSAKTFNWLSTVNSLANSTFVGYLTVKVVINLYMYIPDWEGFLMESRFPSNFCVIERIVCTIRN